MIQPVVPYQMKSPEQSCFHDPPPHFLSYYSFQLKNHQDWNHPNHPSDWGHFVDLDTDTGTSSRDRYLTLYINHQKKNEYPIDEEYICEDSTSVFPEKDQELWIERQKQEENRKIQCRYLQLFILNSFFTLLILGTIFRIL